MKVTTTKPSTWQWWNELDELCSMESHQPYFWSIYGNVSFQNSFSNVRTSNVYMIKTMPLTFHWCHCEFEFSLNIGTFYKYWIDADVHTVSISGALLIVWWFGNTFKMYLSRVWSTSSRMSRVGGCNLREGRMFAVWQRFFVYHSLATN